MSYDVYLNDPVTMQTLPAPAHAEGGMVSFPREDTATMSVTYNYGKHFYSHLDADQGLRWLNGKTAAETTDRLEAAVKVLGDSPSEDYWEDSQGNAGHALAVMLKWAKANPQGVWDVH